MVFTTAQKVSKHLVFKLISTRNTGKYLKAVYLSVFDQHYQLYSNMKCFNVLQNVTLFKVTLGFIRPVVAKKSTGGVFLNLVSAEWDDTRLDASIPNSQQRQADQRKRPKRQICKFGFGKKMQNSNSFMQMRISFSWDIRKCIFVKNCRWCIPFILHSLSLCSLSLKIAFISQRCEVPPIELQFAWLYNFASFPHSSCSCCCS